MNDTDETRTAELRRHAHVCHQTNPVPGTVHETVSNLREAIQFHAEDAAVAARARDYVAALDSLSSQITTGIGRVIESVRAQLEPEQPAHVIDAGGYVWLEQENGRFDCTGHPSGRPMVCGAKGLTLEAITNVFGVLPR